MCRRVAAPARGPALFFLLFALALLLSGCSVWQRVTGRGTDADAAAAGEGRAAFTLEVQAPDALRALLERHLELQRFRQLPDLQDGELQRLLARADVDARELLATQGYFSPRITIETQAAPGAAAAARVVRLRVDPGPQTRVVRADIGFVGHSVSAQTDTPVARPGAPESGARQLQRVQRSWELPPGQPFTQAGWDAAKKESLHQLQARRYPAARLESSRADIDADTSEATLSVLYDPGPPYFFGPLRVEGSQRYDPEGARRIARLPTGSLYSEAQMLDAQQRLAASGYYDTVFLLLDTEAPDPKVAPVVAQVREAPLQKYVFGAGVSTDAGPRLSVDHIHNRVPGIGWRAVSRIALDNKDKLLGTELMDLPDETGWRWFGSGKLQREDTGDYRVNSGRLRAGRSKSDLRIDRSYFLQYDNAHSQGLNPPPTSSSLSANYSWTGRYFNSNLAPTRGYGLGLELGAGSTLGERHEPYARSLLRWQWFVPLGRVEGEDGRGRRSRLAVRTDLGAVLARTNAPVPVTELFLTGGDATVRGYAYRSIGARTENNQLYGGRYLAVGSIEWQRPMLRDGRVSDWENTFFIDAGAVADRVRALDPRVGVGTGVRWRSPVGPLQADLAYGVRVHSLRLHMRLGFNF